MTAEAEQVFTDYLKQKDLKLTSQRRTILRRAMEAEGHFGAEELLDLCRREDSSISKATVYRTLALLKEARLLEEQDFGRGRMVYERSLGHGHHDHFICIRCGKILEFENNKIERLQDEEADKIDFQIVYHSLKLFGFCRDCAPQASR
ncbi:MAG: Ferric uptake regulation protein [Candidatus Omnitrophica bacterium]|nr:Ferric uptake regulation protein [Candidatus Omnitrophota bacterium]